jgi:copper chaperone
MKTVNYKINGMNCNHCVNAVNNALKNCQGVLEVKVSLENNNATLQIDETEFDIETASSAVKNASYELISTIK